MLTTDLLLQVMLMRTLQISSRNMPLHVVAVHRCGSKIMKLRCANIYTQLAQALSHLQALQPVDSEISIWAALPSLIQRP